MFVKMLVSIVLFPCLWSCGQIPKPEPLTARRESCCELTDGGEIPPSLLQNIEEAKLVSDWRYQRQSTWNLLNFLLDPLEPSSALLNWQNWYGEDDLGKIFLSLYSRLSKEQRLARSRLSPVAINAAITNFQSGESRLAETDRISKWFQAAADKAKGQAVPSVERILFNRQALFYMLSHYQDIYNCFRSARRDSCPSFQFPEAAAFIKTAWRRTGDGFQINSFTSDEPGLRSQFEREAWTSEGDWLPNPGDSLSIRNASNKVFHLVGLHLIIRFPNQWLWGSLWLTPKAEQPLSSDQPLPMRDRWRHYQLCTAHSFQSPFEHPGVKEGQEDLAAIARLIQEQPSSNWCSNPFLEFGANNQRTNCIGCHQYAGLDWSQSHLATKLVEDLGSLQLNADTKGPADFVWSLVTGPNAFAFTFADTIEYFDAYDPFE